MKFYLVSVLMCLLLVDYAFGYGIYIRKRRMTKPEFKICVPHQFLDSCNDMAKAETQDGSIVSCVGARDRSQCLSLIQQRSADFTPVDPEDMWVAGSLADEDFKVFDEVRTKEEPNAEFRYEGVAVVHRDLEINSLERLKGLKSCHTGVGRNVGYKIPLTKLRKFGLIGALNDPALSPRENELKAFSTLFSKACIVGKWSTDPDINKRLKRKYSNLCALCEKPDVCDYPDKFSGYDGALRCLAHNGGEIAWTKVYYVKKFFGMPIGNSPGVESKENPEKYAYLCPNGTKFPIQYPTPCVWAARPWQGFITNDDHIANIAQLQLKLKELNKIGEETQASWFERVLTLNNKTFIHEATDVLPAKLYLDKANYTDVIERDYGPPKKTVRFCVMSADEMKKCREFSKMAFSRNIRPQFDCIQQDGILECLKLVRDNGADILTLDASQADLAKREYNLKAIVSEVTGEAGGLYYSVAVVKKSSKYNSFADLRGARSCHPSYGSSAGYNAPLYTLINLGLIPQRSCPYVKAFADFFSGGSCLPGALASENNPEDNNPASLCQNCVGNIDGKDIEKTKCKNDLSEAFFGYNGAFRCLASGYGDVAFISHDTVVKNTDGANKDKWAVSLASADYELLCPTGGRATIADYAKCNLAKIPPNMVVTNNAKNDGEIDEIRHAIIEAGQTFGKRPDLFKLFGPYAGKKDLLFKDSAHGLVAIDKETPVMKDYEKLLQQVRSCDHSDRK